MVLNSFKQIDHTNQQIHSKALHIAAKYKACEVELIDILQQVDQFKIYYKYGSSSLFKYATHQLGLSDEVAYIFINVSRKSREVPALKEEIRKGNITVSKAKKLSPVINTKNQDYWLKVAKTESTRKIERQVALASPKQAVREKLTYIGESKEIAEKTKIITLGTINEEAKRGLNSKSVKARVQLQAGISEKLMLQLRRIQDLVSQKQQKGASLEDALEAMAELYIEKYDPLRKAKRQKMRGKLQGNKKTEPKQEQQKQRRPVPAKIRHQLMLKHNGQCTYIDKQGKKCGSRRFLQIHHIQPVSKGGGNELENLMLICSGHHKLIHI